MRGTIVSLAPLQVGSTMCAVPDTLSLVGFAVGQTVELECRLVAGVLTATKLKHEDGDDENESDHSGSGKSGSGHSGPGSDNDHSGSSHGADDSGSGGDDD